MENEEKLDIYYYECEFTWKKMRGKSYQNVYKKHWAMSNADNIDDLNNDIIAIGMTITRLGLDKKSIQGFRVKEIHKQVLLGQKNK
jgi:hypothetical protein